MKSIQKLRLPSTKADSLRLNHFLEYLTHSIIIITSYFPVGYWHRRNNHVLLLTYNYYKCSADTYLTFSITFIGFAFFLPIGCFPLAAVNKHSDHSTLGYLLWLINIGTMLRSACLYGKQNCHLIVFFQISKIINLDIKKTVSDIRNCILDIQNSSTVILDIQNTYFGYPE